jgi:hypothetical protein
MRKLLTWLVVTLGIAALVRKLRRRGQDPEAVPGLTPPPEAFSAEPADQPEGTDPADELRQKLAESRTGETVPEAESVEERRTEVHEQGRAALDEMQPPGES